jgi:hypothetical protein
MRALQIAAALLLSAGIVGSSDFAFAQDKKKKVTRQEAWSLCTAEVSRIPGDQHSQRYAAGAACMKKYGYRI